MKCGADSFPWGNPGEASARTEVRVFAGLERLPAEMQRKDAAPVNRRTRRLSFHPRCVRLFRVHLELHVSIHIEGQREGGIERADELEPIERAGLAKRTRPRRLPQAVTSPAERIAWSGKD